MLRECKAGYLAAAVSAAILVLLLLIFGLFAGDEETALIPRDTNPLLAPCESKQPVVPGNEIFETEIKAHETGIEELNTEVSLLKSRGNSDSAATINGKVLSQTSGMPVAVACVECYAVMSYDLYVNYPGMRGLYAENVLKEIREAKKDFDEMAEKEGKTAAKKEIQDFVDNCVIRDFITGAASDDDGCFSFNVPFGHFDIVAIKPGNVNIRANEIVSVAGKATEYHIVVTLLDQASSLEGFVFDSEGKPVQYAKITISVESGILGDDERERGREAKRISRVELISDSAGHFRWEDAWVGARCTTFVNKEGYLIEFRKVCVEQGINRLNFELSMGRILSGRIRDEKGEALPGAAITYSQKTERSITFSKQVSSDEEGLFAISGINEGAFLQMLFEKEGYVPVRKDVEFVGNRHHMELVMKKGEGGRIRGYVRDCDGNPIDAEVTLMEPGSSIINRRTMTNDDGYFYFDGLANQKYYVYSFIKGQEQERKYRQRGEYTARIGEVVNIIFDKSDTDSGETPGGKSPPD